MTEPPIHPRSLAATASGLDKQLGWFVVADILLLILGWMLPIMTVERLLFLSERLSILEGVGQLWAHGDYVLFLLIAVREVESRDVQTRIDHFPQPGRVVR